MFTEVELKDKFIRMQNISEICVYKRSSESLWKMYTVKKQCHGTTG